MQRTRFFVLRLSELTEEMRLCGLTTLPAIHAFITDCDVIKLHQSSSRSKLHHEEGGGWGGGREREEDGKEDERVRGVPLAFEKVETLHLSGLPPSPFLPTPFSLPFLPPPLFPSLSSLTPPLFLPFPPYPLLSSLPFPP